MDLSKEELWDRWINPDGEKRLAEVVKALQKKQVWGDILEGFPGANETLWGRDLRGAQLSSAHLKGASLRYAHLEGADLSSAYSKIY